MVDGLGPGLEQPVHLRQVRNLGPVADLNEELVPDSPEIALYFPSSLGFPGREWMSFMPRTAQPRSSHASTKALPLSRLCRRRHNLDCAEHRVVPTLAAAGLAAAVNARKLSA